MNFKKMSFSMVAFSFLVNCVLAINPKEGENQSNGEFSYIGARGPNNWKNLKPEYATCSNGKQQSPINIIKSAIVPKTTIKPVAANFISANATLHNLGHVVQLQFNDNIGSIEICGKKYFFKQLHWHTPSEHLINGIRFPVEVHLVHEAKDRSLAVIGIFYQLSQSPKDVDPLLSALKDAMTKLLHAKSGEVPVGVIDTKAITANANKFYRYAGSLTSPPCTENVIWTVLDQTRLISKEQVETLKAIVKPEFKNNARPEQPLNGREIELYNEKL